VAVFERARMTSATAGPASARGRSCSPRCGGRASQPTPSLGIDVLGRTGLGPDGGVIHELAVPGRHQRLVAHLAAAAAGRCRMPLYRRRQGPDRVRAAYGGVTGVFADGRRPAADLLIAADGLHSTVRGKALSRTRPRYAGYVAWRGVIEPHQLAPELHELMFRRMVFGFPTAKLLLSIPMPVPQGEAGERCCHFVWFRPADESALRALLHRCRRPRHGLSIPPPLIRPELIEGLKRDAAALLAPQLAALVNGTAQIILQPIFDLESPRVAIGRVALIGDAAFVARPHVASGVMKAALDAEALVDALSAGAGDVEAALQRYDAGRQPYGAWLVQRGRHIGATIAARNAEPSLRVETVMREYGAAGLVRDQPIAARAAD
jgi:2-polyprenyl-6-methoxyphenol hydroxylase-like FAD-dependent oxidoreductase